METVLIEEKDGIVKKVANTIFTFVAFVIFVALLPLFVILYLGVAVCRYLWLKRLCQRAKHLEFVKNTTARTAMDTHRNQAVITILLQVKGQCDVELVKQKIKENVVGKRKRDGSLRFPHMQMTLVSYWGRYAWVRDASGFNLDNHVINDYKPFFRNRVVTSSNIQEYVSEAVTKYIPPWDKRPPWELRIITTAESDRFYILARLHHLYISEDDITFGDLLVIRPEDFSIGPKRDIDSVENILASIVRKPKVLPAIYQRLNEYLSNCWNEIISVYDPQLNPSVLKSDHFTVLECFVIFALTLYSAFRDYWYKSEDDRTSSSGFDDIFRREAGKRQLSVSLAVRALSNTLHPKVALRWFLFLVRRTVGLPLAVASRLRGELFVYLRFGLIAVQAGIEAFRLFYLLYITPRVMIEEVLVPMFMKPKHHLQQMSMSGRKVVSWTNPIPIEIIKAIREKTGTASCEIELYGVAAALSEYFKRLNVKRPNVVLTTVRFVAEEDILKSSNQISSGLLCLPLPIRVPRDDPLYGLHQIQIALQNALTDQTALYLASLRQFDYGILTTIFPSILTRVMLYVLSKRYPIMLTQIEAHNKELQRRNLIWGQEVEAFFYWRPPQANTSMSLSLISYGDELRFAVMTDQILSPDYNIIVNEFAGKLNQLAKESDEYKPPSQLTTAY